MTPTEETSLLLKEWTIQKFDSLDELRATQIRDWQRLSSSVRRQAAWEMVVEAWTMKKRNPDELRLLRLVTSVRKA